MRESLLPPEFESLDVHYVRERIRGKEWSSSCPKCGGEPHKGGDWPDRFRMWPKSKIGIPFGWCRICNFKWTPEREYKSDPMKIEQWRQARIVEEIRIRDEAQRAIELLTNEHHWRDYYDYLDSHDVAKDTWAQAGIIYPIYWLNWNLGYDPAHHFWYDSGEGWKEHVTPTMTIPVRNLDGKIINIKHRLLNPQPDGTKYRMEYRTNTEPCFITNFENDQPKYTKTIILVEGEKKAGVVFITLDMNIQVIGLPKSPSDEMMEGLASRADRVFQIIDPDVTDTSRQAAIFKNYRVMRPPEKIDDMIINYGLQKEHIISRLKYAERINS